MSEKQGFRHFDLPVDLLEKSGGWVPAKSQDSSEIEELKVLPAGTALARRQEAGVEVAARILGYLRDKDFSNTGPRALAAGSFATAFYLHAENIDNVTRRRQLLPVHIDAIETVSRESLATQASLEFDEATTIASLLTYCTEHKSAATGRYQQTLGRMAGNSALVLASLPYAAAIERSVSDVDKQQLTRHGAMQMRTDVKDMRSDLGVYPSLAQLSERYGALPVYMQRAGDPLLSEALDYAQTAVLDANNELSPQ